MLNYQECIKVFSAKYLLHKWRVNNIRLLAKVTKLVLLAKKLEIKRPLQLKSLLRGKGSQKLSREIC